jgi:hypothetical protein
MPAPRRYAATGETCRIRADRLDAPASLHPGILAYARLALAPLAEERTGPDARPSAPELAGGVVLDLDPSAPVPPQGYTLTLHGGGARLTARDEPGLFYAVGALKQLVQLHGAGLPGCRIEDNPDFSVRGFLLDISRDKVPTMDTLFRLVDLLADLRINQLQLYTEHTFAYSRHRVVWDGADPMTPDQVRSLDAYCADRFIELVPNQNSFGHLGRWLMHPPYRELAECEGLFPVPWGGHRQGPFSLDPNHPGSLALLEALYDELLPCFRSRIANVGCDETFDLGVGRSRAECERRGKGRVYLDFLLRIHDALQRRGSRMMFWGDIVLQHPELVRELPDDAIVLNWGYEADHPFERQCPRFAEAGKPFYVCPGTSSWNAIVGRTANALKNLDRAAEAGLEWGAQGYLITDWGDHGHWQPLSVSFLGLVAGAGLAWCRRANGPDNLLPGLDAQVFRDNATLMGQMVHDLGNTYQAFAAATVNRSWLHTFLAAPHGRVLAPEVHRPEVESALANLEQAVLGLERARPLGSEGVRSVREFQHAARLAAFGCRRWLSVHRGFDHPGQDELRALLEEFAQVWLLRNRRGGLADSLARFGGLREFVAAR